MTAGHDTERTRYRLGVDVAAPTPISSARHHDGELSVERCEARRRILRWACSRGRQIHCQGIPPSQIVFLSRHHITTNALLEMRGAKVGLLITQGYRACRKFRTKRATALVRYFYSKPAAIAPQHLTKEIPERCDYAGRVLRPLDKDAVRRAARELKDPGRVDRRLLPVLVMNPAHEQERARDPGGMSAVTSRCRQVLPRIREWPGSPHPAHAYLSR